MPPRSSANCSRLNCTLSPAASASGQRRRPPSIEVHGIKRRSSLFNTARIDHIYEDPHNPDPRFILHYGDMTDSTSLIHIVQKVQPDEIYNLAAQSHVQVSFEEPEYTANSDALGG